MFARLPDMPEARCIVLTGAGSAFCAGGDVKGMGGGGEPRPTSREAVIADLSERQRTLTGALHALPQPTIAALPGAAAGLSIALACPRGGRQPCLRISSSAVKTMKLSE